MTKTNRRLKKFWNSKSGGVLIYVAFGLPILVGAMALSIDLGRAFILNTELKDFSDAAALAGAAELDGRNGARAAAEQAARTGLDGTLVNIQAFATDGGGPNMAIQDVVFLRTLPEDGTNFTVDDTATSDQDARFIFVSVVNRNVRSGLSRVLGVIPDFDTTAKSIAGFNTVVCRVPAMFMCNPLEDLDFPVTQADGSVLPGCDPTPYPAGDLGEGAPLTEACLRGRGMLLKNGGGGGSGAGAPGVTSQYFPGEFGLLECPDGLIPNNNGMRCVAESIAQSAPPVCIASRAFVQTGQGAGPIRQAINTRFDSYENPHYGGPGIKSDPNYRAPLNVTKGYEPSNGQSCSEPAADPATVAPLPRDTCFASGTCAGNRYGVGDWHGATAEHPGGQGWNYWNINHGNSGATPPDFNQTNPPLTRYEMYRLEIESESSFTLEVTQPGPGLPKPGGAPDGPTLEDGRACNYTGGGESDPAMDANTTGLDEIDRRLLVLTAVNCLEHGPFQGNQPDGIPVEGYIQVFLTEPAQTGGPEQLRVWGELHGVLERGDEGLRDIVQLYR